MPAILLRLLVALPYAVRAASSEHIDFLFILFDAGESNQLQATIDLIAALSTSSVMVLALGSPATQIFAGRPYMRTLSDMGIDSGEAWPPNGRIDPSRSTTLSERSLAKLTAAWPSVRVVVPGMAYLMQLQLARAWPQASMECTMDGFGLWNDNWLAARYFMDAQNPSCKEVLVPTHVQGSTLVKQHPETHVTVVGAPGMEAWRKVAGDVGLVGHARKTLYGDNPGVLLAGGYGEGHNQTLQMFCEAAKVVMERSFAYSPHPGPGLDGLNADRELFRMNGCERIDVTWDKPMRLDNGKELAIDTIVASAASIATVSRYSTVGGQSLYIGIPHCYIDGPHPSKQNVFSKNIPVAQSIEELVQWIRGPGSRRYDSSRLNDILPHLGTGSSVKLAEHLLSVARNSSVASIPQTCPNEWHKPFIIGVAIGSIAMIVFCSVAACFRRKCASVLHAEHGQTETELTESFRQSKAIATCGGGSFEEQC